MSNECLNNFIKKTPKILYQKTSVWLKSPITEFLSTTEDHSLAKYMDIGGRVLRQLGYKQLFS